VAKVDSTNNVPEGQATKKRNRQKERLARRAAEQEEASSKAAEEASNQTDHRAIERETMEREIQARGLVEQEVRSDGHCLYAAMADQLKANAISTGSETPPDYKSVRHDAAAFIQDHADDFVPFLEEPLDEYVTKIRDTGEWGGQLELSALSRAYGITINVLQGDGRLERIESDNASKEVWLAYYRHIFGLGEHYNSLRKKKELKPV
jgi:OTU domain-containing protein 6